MNQNDKSRGNKLVDSLYVCYVQDTFLQIIDRLQKWQCWQISIAPPFPRSQEPINYFYSCVFSYLVVGPVGGLFPWDSDLPVPEKQWVMALCKGSVCSSSLEFELAVTLGVAGLLGLAYLSQSCRKRWVLLRLTVAAVHAGHRRCHGSSKGVQASKGRGARPADVHALSMAPGCRINLRGLDLEDRQCCCGAWVRAVEAVQGKWSNLLGGLAQGMA